MIFKIAWNEIHVFVQFLIFFVPEGFAPYAVFPISSHVGPTQVIIRTISLLILILVR